MSGASDLAGQAYSESARRTGGRLQAFLTTQSPRTLAVLGAGLTVSAGGTIAAIATGANAALAMLIGYSALTGTAALALTVRNWGTVAAPAICQPPTAAATSPAWKLVSVFTVSDASRLWCGIEPGATATQESMAWGRALVDAIRRGELPIVRRAGSTDEAFARERSSPHYMTPLARDALKLWAARHGHSPAFLAD